MGGSVIFHHPGPTAPAGSSGSQVRPWQLLKAFTEMGYEVEAVVGRGAERKSAIKRLRADVRRGRRFSFVYSEARSIPTLMTERHRLPRYPLLDHRFLHEMRSRGLPVGLFYRDVFWRFPMYRDMLPAIVRSVTVPLYWYDWWWYQRVVDHLFLPSRGMADHLPRPWPRDRLSALPPGTARIPGELAPGNADGSQHTGLRLLYVGGVRPPTYDLRPLFEAVESNSSLQLTVCCRRQEWEEWRAYYSAAEHPRVRVVHATGEALAPLYSEADVFALIRQPDEYLDFAVPVKLFEAIGHGVPILTTPGTEAARIVQRDGLGWVIDPATELPALLERLAGERRLVREKTAMLREAAQRHSWNARVQEIRERLEAYGGP